MSPKTSKIYGKDVLPSAFVRSYNMHTASSTNDNTILMDRRVFMGGLVAAALVGTFSPFASVSAFADPTSAEKQAEADEVKKKLDAWAAELDQASTKYYLALEAHDTAVSSMEDAQGRITEAEGEVTRLQEKLGTRAASMYKQGELSFFEVLFGAHSFSEFTSSWTLLNNINNDDAVMIEGSKKARQEAQAARDEYAVQEKLAEQKLSEANEIKARAEELVAATQAELDSLNAEIAELIEKERQEEERRQREAAEAAAREAARNAGGGGSGGGNGGSGGGRGDGIPSFSGSTIDIIIQAAESRLGCPYVWGGNGPNSFDCSGLTKWCYAQAGISIGRVDTSQRDGARSLLPISEAQPGDILWRYGHVGLYIGGGTYIHAPQTGDVVRYATNIYSFTYACRY
jgi:cell wall-associated NlpC family hydrolase